MGKKKKSSDKKRAAHTVVVEDDAQEALGPRGAERIEFVQLDQLKVADYNPRSVTDAQLDAICRSIVEFGLVDPIIARRENGLIIGGHQRKAAIERLLAGEYKAGGKPVRWQLPAQGVPVVFLDVDEQRAKLLNVTLNKVTGDWDYEGLSQLFGQLSSEGLALSDLQVTGFSPAEITDFTDLANSLTLDGPEQFADGTMPTPPQKSPKLDLDFSSKELRDAVKTRIAAATAEGELGGDALARLLEAVT